VSVAAGAVTTGRVPVPLKAIVWGEPLALSAILTVPVRVPTAVGVKVTEIVHFAPAARLVPQLFVCVKSPVAATDVIAKAALPELVRVDVWIELIVPVVCAGKLMLVGVTINVGAAAITYAAVATGLSAYPLATASADNVSLEETVIALVNTVDEVVGVVPSIVK